MNISTVYLETTMFNFYFADDAPNKKLDTLKMFTHIAEGKYKPYTSYVAMDEILQTKEPNKREAMLELINKYDVAVFKNDRQADYLADVYIREGVIPLKYRDDALHIAVATLEEMHIILSWNFQHIVKLKTRNLVNVINIREGYRHLEICSPREVIEDDAQ